MKSRTEQLARAVHDRHAQLPREVWLILTGVLLVTMPALTLIVAYVALRLTRSVLLDRLTMVEVVELYLVELVMFSVFTYVLYRLTLYTLSLSEDAERETVTSDGSDTQ